MYILKKVCLKIGMLFFLCKTNSSKFKVHSLKFEEKDTQTNRADFEGIWK